MTSPTPKWFSGAEPGRSAWYVDRFRRLAAEGADLEGEARFVDAMVARGSRILDAGCGIGRVAAALNARGHDVVGVDVDETLVAEARANHPDLTWVRGDLTTFELPGRTFDAAVCAGNVMPYLAEGTGAAALSRIAAHLVPGGRLVVGFGAGRGYEVAEFDADTSKAGLVREHRFATWQLDPWTPDADFQVAVLRRP